jgi:histidine triad (HIT) family protein
MGSVFSRIISGEFPAHFVWKDERCVAFLSINPLGPGHTLVVPRTEVDHWIDLDGQTLKVLMQVSQTVARALQVAFNPTKVGLMIAGLEVPHVHVHLCPIDGPHDLDLAKAGSNPGDTVLAEIAARISAELPQ